MSKLQCMVRVHHSLFTGMVGAQDPLVNPRNAVAFHQQ